MYNSTFQVSYRRKVYEEVATLAYQRRTKEAFKWLPEWIVSNVDATESTEDIFSDLDYAAELCSAALGREPSRYLHTLADPAFDVDADVTAPFVGVLNSLCHRCTSALDAEPACLSVCPNGAITLADTGRAVLDATACVSCGACVGACAQGAIVDKSCLYPVIRAIGDGRPVMALLMPSLSEQLAAVLRKEQLTSAFRMLGFQDVFEIGPTAHTYLSADPEQLTQEIASMVAGIQDRAPDTMIVTVTANAMSKLDIVHSMRTAGVDHVLTLEELMGMLDARGISDEILWDQDEEPLKYTRGENHLPQYAKEEGVTIDDTAAKMCG